MEEEGEDRLQEMICYKSRHETGEMTLEKVEEEEQGGVGGRGRRENT